MSPRNKIVHETPESKALKELRQKREMSLQKLADLLQVSKQIPYFMESGRGHISSEYVVKFLDALDYTLADFEHLVGKEAANKGPGLRQRCHDKLDKIEDSKLEKIFDYLSQF